MYHDRAAHHNIAAVSCTLAFAPTPMAAGERLGFSGGWTDKGGGHALMFCAERGEQSFNLVVCNTGEGVTNHPVRTEYHPPPPPPLPPPPPSSMLAKLVNGR